MGRGKAFDWSFHDDFPEVDCFCRCGAVFKSHMTVRRTANGNGPFEIITRAPCPGCSAKHRVMRGERDEPDFDIAKV